MFQTDFTKLFLNQINQFIGTNITVATWQLTTLAFPSPVCPEEGCGWDPSAAERGDREEPDAVGPGPGPLRHGGRGEGQVFYLVS